MTGRTVAEVLTDPRHRELVDLADKCFAESEASNDLATSWEWARRGILVMRCIGDHERVAAQLLQNLRDGGLVPVPPPRDLADTSAAAEAPERCAMGCTRPCARQESTGWCHGMS